MTGTFSGGLMVVAVVELIGALIIILAISSKDETGSVKSREHALESQKAA